MKSPTKEVLFDGNISEVLTLTLYHTILTFNDPNEEGFGKH